jgi:hypothetical protein
MLVFVNYIDIRPISLIENIQIKFQFQNTAENRQKIETQSKLFIENY